MITERDLKEAIAECQGIRDPNANTCVKLAAYYIILDHIQEQALPTYSYAPAPTVDFSGESEFAQKIKGMESYRILEVMDELMTTLSVLNPSLYNGVMRKLSD